MLHFALAPVPWIPPKLDSRFEFSCSWINSRSYPIEGYCFHGFQFINGFQENLKPQFCALNFNRRFSFWIRGLYAKSDLRFLRSFKRTLFFTKIHQKNSDNKNGDVLMESRRLLRSRCQLKYSLFHTFLKEKAKVNYFIKTLSIRNTFIKYLINSKSYNKGVFSESNNRNRWNKFCNNLFHKRKIIMNIGLLIKKIRTTRGLKQSDLVELTNLSKSYISEIERGVKTPRLEQLELISSALNVPLSVMFFLALEKNDVLDKQKEDVVKELSLVVKKISKLFELESDVNSRNKLERDLSKLLVNS